MIIKPQEIFVKGAKKIFEKISKKVLTKANGYGIISNVARECVPLTSVLGA